MTMSGQLRSVSVYSPRIRCRTAGSRRRSQSAIEPPAWAHFGIVTASPVDEAVYGYWSAMTSTPSAWARSIIAVDSFTLPQLRFCEAL